MHRPKQSKAEACIYIYIPIHILPFHHAEKESSDLWATIPSNSAGYGADAPTCPMFPALLLHIKMLPFT